jgi:hypothetical protein
MWHVSSTNSGFDKYIVFFHNTVGGIKYVLHLDQITFVINCYHLNQLNLKLKMDKYQCYVCSEKVEDFVIFYGVSNVTF